MDAAVIASVAGAGWAAGINLYGAALALGLFGRFTTLEVPDALTRTDTLVVVGILFLLEFVADKIPIVDSVWDLIHTAVRPAGAAVLALLLTGEAETMQQAAAALGAGGLALSAHVTKATTRLAVNTSPEPISNAGVSLLEDGLVAVVIWFALSNPLIALVLVLVLVIAGTAVTVALFAVARRGVRAWRERRRGRRLGPGPPAAPGPERGPERGPELVPGDGEDPHQDRPTLPPSA